MKKLFLLLSLLFFFFVTDINAKTEKFDIDDIKNDTTYFWGVTPTLSSDNEAYDMALQELYENIAYNCGATAIYIGDKEHHVQLKNVISTFESSIREKSARYALCDNFEKDEYSYFVYLKRSEFREICQERKSRIERFTMLGMQNEIGGDFQLEESLKYYYWAMMLCMAHPYGRNLKINVNDEAVLAYYWLLDRIDGPNGILNSISILLPKENALQKTDDGYIVSLTVRTTTGLPISNLRFAYNNGNRQIPTNVNKGMAYVELYDDFVEKLNIRIEYAFEMESVAYHDVNVVLKKIEGTLLKNSRKTINLSRYLNNQEEEEVELGDFATAENFSSVDDNGRRIIDKKFQIKDTDYLSVMQNIEEALRNHSHETVRHHFTDEGYGMLDTLSRYGKMTVVGQQNYSFIKFSNQVICRGIKMKFDFKNHASFNRELIFRFDHDSRKVSSIAFRLSNVTEKDILSKNKWSEEARLVLINFLEDYQTAYALKRRDYLESIYSDDALIIVGHVVKKTVIEDRAQFLLEEDEIRLMEYDKNTYFKNLTRTFKLQEYIDLRFAETDFKKAPQSDRDIYGVRLLQEYHSTTYGDVGYLFLLVDLSNDHPLIHVRAWQPDEVDLDKLMQMKDLRF